MPVYNGKVHRGRLPGFSNGNQLVTNPQVEPPNQHVEAVKPSCEIEPTSKHRVAECKRSSRVFQVLTIQKLHPLPNSSSLVQAHCFHISSIYSIFCCISSKVTPQQKKSVGFRLSKEVYWHNSKRRPTHSDLNSRHKSPMLEGPLLPDKEHSLAPNKQHHSQMQSRFYFPGMEPQYSFAIHITPPDSRSVSQREECNSRNSGSSSILVKYHNQRSSHPQKTQPSLSRPRTRVHEVVPVVRPTSNMTRGSGTISIFHIRVPGAPIRPIVHTDHKIFVIQNFQSHCNKKIMVGA